MRILFAVESYHWGGRRTYISRLAQWSGRRDLQLVAWVEPGSPAQLQLAAYGVETHAPPSAQGERWMREHDIQLVQTDGYAFELATMAQRAGIPHLFRLGAIPELGVRQYHPDQGRALALALTTLSQARVCPSRFIARHLIETQVIPNGVDVRALRPRPKPWGQCVAMLAHWLPAKRHQDFIQAARLLRPRFPQARFHLWGQAYFWPGAQEYAHQVKAWLQECPWLEHGHFDSLDEFPPADVVVLPSLDEGCSNAVLEAMAAGRAVVASDSGANPELVQHQITGLLVPPADPMALAEAIASLLERPERALELGQAACQYVVRHHDLDLCLERYLQLYRQLVSSEGGAAQPSLQQEQSP